MIVDVKTAFLYASVSRKIFVRLPPEAARGARTHGRLKRAMYGTRDAPRLWQEHLASTLRGLGFVESETNNGYFYHRELDIEAVVHVDDILFTGELTKLNRVYEELIKKYSDMGVKVQ